MKKLNGITAKDLMLGDWVETYNYLYEKFFKEEVKCLKPKAKIIYRPIPITSKMMELNGFEDRGEAGWQNPFLHLTYYLDDAMFCNGIPYIDEDIDIIHNVNYVHELQHALRLCGVTYLADNFIIPTDV